MLAIINKALDTYRYWLSKIKKLQTNTRNKSKVIIVTILFLMVPVIGMFLPGFMIISEYVFISLINVQADLHQIKDDQLEIAIVQLQVSSYSKEPPGISLKDVELPIEVYIPYDK